MNKFIFAFALTFASFGMQAEAKQLQQPSQLLEMQSRNFGKPTYGQCRRMLRQAGYLSRGRGAKSRNFMAIDACMRNGGMI